jgi:molybdate transport system substrate-binding protein
MMILVALPIAPATRAQDVRVAAAADLKFAMQDVAAQFEKKTGTKVQVTYGSSGNFFSQLQNGAPFDLFFSADIEYPRKLESAGFAEPGTLYEYAVGRIAIWTPADATVDVTQLGWQTLLDPSVPKISIANPEHAPYGRAAVAQAGIVAMSLAVSPGMKDGKRWEIPADMHPPIEQATIVLKSAANKDGARAFLEFVKSETGRATLATYGFTFPAAAPPAGSPKK